MKADVSLISYRPKLLLAAAAAAVLVVLALLPPFIGLYQTQLLTYGLIAAIAALGFNLLLGYTGLLSFGHSAFFGIGAYAVAFLLRDAGIRSMELYILIGVPVAAIASALFGYICVRHTRIFFGILTLGAVAGAVDADLQVFLGHRRVGRPARGAADPARRHGQLHRAGRVPAFHQRLLLLRAGRVRVVGRADVGDRPFAVRQIAAGDPRQ